MFNHYLLRLFLATTLPVLFVSAVHAQDSAQSVLPDSFGEVLFIENLGQIRDGQGDDVPNVLFMTRTQGLDIYITRSGIAYLFHRSVGADVCTAAPKSETDASKAVYHRMDVEFLGMNHDINVIKEEAVEQQFYYYTAEFPDGISPTAYKRITIENIYDGIDLVCYENEGRMKYDFIADAGADISKLKMLYKGALDLYVDDEGSLIATTSLGEIKEEKPYSYSRVTGRTIDSDFKVSDQTVSIDLVTNPDEGGIIIDPIRIWATYYGGASSEDGEDICSDSLNNVYVTGKTGSSDFPTHVLPGAYNQTTITTAYDAFILKFNASGVRQWATFYGGSGIEERTRVCVDHSDNLYVVGITRSDDFPLQTLPGAYNQTTINSEFDNGFILKFNNSGERIWATYYGGDYYDMVKDVCVDGSDNLYVTGWTFSDSDTFPLQVLPGAYNQTELGLDDCDGFILKFNSSGERLWATYYGGSSYDRPWSLCTDSSDNLLMTGQTESVDFPLQSLSGAYNQPTHGGDYKDVFILKFNSSGERVWATFYGGGGDDQGWDIHTDGADHIYLTGNTESSDFPTQALAGAYNQPAKAGYKNVFILKFTGNGERLWSTCYGGSISDYGHAICTDSTDNLYVTGQSTSHDFPTQTMASAYNQTVYTNSSEAFILKFNNLGKRRWATYYGGSGTEDALAMCMDHSDNFYLTGYTYSNDWPTKLFDGAYYQPPGSYPPYKEAFLLKFALPLLADAYQLSVSAGGTIDLFLKTGEANAGRRYLILGSLTGSIPGIPLPNGGATLPINWDRLTDLVIRQLNQSLFTNFLEYLDAQGTSFAQINAPAGLNPNLIGKTMTYAYCLEGQPDWDFVSNPVEVEFMP